MTIGPTFPKLAGSVSQSNVIRSFVASVRGPSAAQWAAKCPTPYGLHVSVVGAASVRWTVWALAAAGSAPSLWQAEAPTPAATLFSLSSLVSCAVLAVCRRNPWAAVSSVGVRPQLKIALVAMLTFC